MKSIHDKVRVGIVGVGKMGELHLSKYLALSELCEVVGIYEQRKERSLEVSSKYNVREFQSIDELLNRVDGVVICVLVESHFEVAEKALRKGVSVFIEKPMTETLQQANFLYNFSSSQNDLVISVGFLERIRLEKIKTYIDENHVLPTYIECQRKTVKPHHDLKTDVITDLMIHDLDIVLMIYNSPPVSVNVWAKKLFHENYDVAVCDLQFSANRRARIAVGRASRVSRRTVEIFAKGAYWDIDLVSDSFRSVIDQQDKIIQNLGGDVLLTQAKKFLTAMSSGSANHHPSKEQSIWLFQIIDKIKESLDKKHHETPEYYDSAVENVLSV